MHNLLTRHENEYQEFDAVFPYISGFGFFCKKLNKHVETMDIINLLNVKSEHRAGPPVLLWQQVFRGLLRA